MHAVVGVERPKDARSRRAPAHVHERRAGRGEANKGAQRARVINVIERRRAVGSPDQEVGRQLGVECNGGDAARVLRRVTRGHVGAGLEGVRREWHG